METNYAFIDGQNLHYGTRSESWKVDIFKFRQYLRYKYKVEKAFYFLGCVQDENEDLYNDLQESGFIVVFREHHNSQKGTKKGNVDTDIVFEIMRRVHEQDFNKVVLVSGDGDYIKTVKWLVKKGKLEKILFPNNKFSSLYNPLSHKFGSNLSNPDIRKKIEYIPSSPKLPL